MKIKLAIAALLLSTGAYFATAQDAGGERPRGPGGPGGEGRGGRMMGGPVMAALDANKDGELDATEIANASAALKTLDKNSDGKLTGEELRPEGRGRGPGGPGGPGGEGRERRGGGQGGTDSKSGQ